MSSPKSPNANDQAAGDQHAAAQGAEDPNQDPLGFRLHAEHSDAGNSDSEQSQAGDSANTVESLVAELAAEKERVLRLRAEMENLRSRASRELREERRYAALPLARDVLPAIDNVDRAIEAAEQDHKGGSLLEGFRMVRQQLLGVLQQHHCEPIDAAGQPFDPQFHEAILQQPSNDCPANHVLMVTQQGYRMHDRVVRAAQVIVSSGPADSTE
jgi:molecular chaperone GrpE